MSWHCVGSVPLRAKKARPAVLLLGAIVFTVAHVPLTQCAVGDGQPLLQQLIHYCPFYLHLFSLFLLSFIQVFFSRA